jgi:hypothetical protein
VPVEVIRIPVTAVFIVALAIAVIWTGLAGPGWFVNLSTRGRVVLALLLLVMLAAGIASQRLAR